MPKATRAAPPPNGAVFLYPYLWDWQERSGTEQGKDRSCCLAFVLKREKGPSGLVILPISDRRPTDDHLCLEVPSREKVIAGLDPKRPAYVHLSEYNYDQFPGSVFLPPRKLHLGKFSESFTRAIISNMMRMLKEKRMKQINRTV